VVSLATVAAAVLGFYQVGAKSLWRDEAYSVIVARSDWAGFWRVIVPQEANGGLHYLLLRWWTALGSSEAVVRSLSVAFAAAAVPLLYGVGRRLLGRESGMVAAVLLTVNAFFIRYAQEARGYALVTFLVTAATLLLLRALERPSAGRWGAYVVVATLAVYSHFFAGLVLAVHGVYALRSSSARARVVVAFGLIGLGVSPLLVPVTTVDHLNWIARPSIRHRGGAFTELAGAGGLPLLIGCFLVSTAGLLATLSRPERAVRQWYAFLVGWLFVPVLVSFLFSLLVKPVFIPRYLIVSLPALTLLVAAGIGCLRPRMLRGGALLVILLLEIRGLHDWYANQRKEDWRAATPFVVARARPGDGLVFHSAGTRAPFDYYLGRLELDPNGLDPLRPTQPWGRLDLLDPAATADLGRWLIDWRGDRPRLWLILKYPVPLPSEFLARYCLGLEEEFSGVHVLLYQRRPCGNDPPS
jgi:mannosyltransferase